MSGRKGYRGETGQRGRPGRPGDPGRDAKGAVGEPGGVSRLPPLKGEQGEPVCLKRWLHCLLKTSFTHNVAEISVEHTSCHEITRYNALFLASTIHTTRKNLWLV